MCICGRALRDRQVRIRADMKPTSRCDLFFICSRRSSRIAIQSEFPQQKRVDNLWTPVHTPSTASQRHPLTCRSKLEASHLSVTLPLSRDEARAMRTGLRWLLTFLVLCFMIRVTDSTLRVSLSGLATYMKPRLKVFLKLKLSPDSLR